MLKLEKTIEGGKAVLKMGGRLDTVTSSQLDEELKALPDDISGLTLDMEKLEYISSAGLRVLLKGHKMMASRGGMKLIHVGQYVMEVLDVTGLIAILTIA